MKDKTSETQKQCQRQRDEVINYLTAPGDIHRLSNAIGTVDDEVVLSSTIDKAAVLVSAQHAFERLNDSTISIDDLKEMMPNWYPPKELSAEQQAADL